MIPGTIYAVGVEDKKYPSLYHRSPIKLSSTIMGMYLNVKQLNTKKLNYIMIKKNGFMPKCLNNFFLFFFTIYQTTVKFKYCV